VYYCGAGLKTRNISALKMPNIFICKSQKICPSWRLQYSYALFYKYGKDNWKDFLFCRTFICRSRVTIISRRLASFIV